MASWRSSSRSRGRWRKRARRSLRRTCREWMWRECSGACGERLRKANRNSPAVGSPASSVLAPGRFAHGSRIVVRRQRRWLLFGRYFDDRRLVDGGGHERGRYLNGVVDRRFRSLQQHGRYLGKLKRSSADLIATAEFTQPE